MMLKGQLLLQFMNKTLHTIQYNTIQYFIPIRVPQGAITNIHS
jgi:hypothetical protein